MLSANAVRERILSHGLGVASAHGLHALSMGDLARDLELPKTGLYAHFSSKESLQLGVLEQAAAMFLHDVIEAAVAAEPGEPRIKALFTKWLKWSNGPRLRGGCPFVLASSESEALPAIVKVRLKEVLDHWSGVLEQAIEEAKQTTFRSDIEAEQFIFELYGLYLSHHFWHWSMHDVSAHGRTMAAFNRLMATARVAQTD